MKKINLLVVGGLALIVGFSSALGSGGQPNGVCASGGTCIANVGAQGKAVGGKGASAPGDPCGTDNSGGPNDGNGCKGFVPGGGANE